VSGVPAGLLHERGLAVDRVTEREIDRPAHPWPEQAATEKSAAARIHEAFVAELDGGTGNRDAPAPQRRR